MLYRGFEYWSILNIMLKFIYPDTLSNIYIIITYIKYILVHLDQWLGALEVMDCLAILDHSHKQYSQLAPPLHMQGCFELVCVQEEVGVDLHI